MKAKETMEFFMFLAEEDLVIEQLLDEILVFSIFTYFCSNDIHDLKLYILIQKHHPGDMNPLPLLDVIVELWLVATGDLQRVMMNWVGG